MEFRLVERGLATWKKIRPGAKGNRAELVLEEESTTEYAGRKPGGFSSPNSV